MEFTKEEWRDVYFYFHPNATEKDYDWDWEEFQIAKAKYYERMKVN